MIDYHIHTDISGDGSVSMKFMADAAQRKGLKEICFTEHIDLDFPCEIDFSVDFDEYTARFDAIKNAYPGIRIRKGVEAGLDMRTKDRFEDLLSGQAIDYVVGSQHSVFGYDPYYKEVWQHYTKQQIYTQYLRETMECIKACDFYDVLGHLGYIAKFCPYKENLMKYCDYPDEIDSILKTLVYKGKGLEINTNGLFMTSSTMPETPILIRFFELGGEIVTVGSDAHKESVVGHAANETLDVLKEIGFQYVCAFDAGKPRFIPIP